MKKLALTIVATIVVAVVAKGQDTTVYLPAFELGQIWTEVRGNYEEASSAWITMDSSVTVVDSVEYYGFQLVELTYNCFFSGRSFGTIYMRQSDDHSRVYLVGECYEETDFTYERLVYDLDLNVGDTMYYFRVPMVVDSVYTQDGRKHVRFDYRVSNYGMLEYVTPEFDLPLEFVEGIGPSWGWMWGDDVDYEGWPSLLLCVWRDGEQVNEGIAELYERHLRHDDGYPYSCTINNPIGKIDDFGQASYKVYPNPVGKVLTIAGLPEKKATVAVYDMLGNRLIGVECMGPEAEIDLSHLPCQLLLVSVLMDEGCSTYKVVKL